MSAEQSQQRQQFSKALMVLGALARIELSPDIMVLYYSELAPLGLEQVIGAMRDLAKSTSPRTGLPTIEAIENKIRPKLHDKDLAAELSFNVINAISKFGWCNGEKAKEHLGELGWEVVRRMGGWGQFCGLSDDTPLTILESKTREVAKLVIMRAQGAEFNFPRLPESQERKSITSATNNVIKLLAKEFSLTETDQDDPENA